MEAKTYAENLIKVHGLDEAVRIIKLINIVNLKASPDLFGTNKKKQSFPLTNNSKTAKFFENVRGYLKNKTKVVK